MFECNFKNGLWESPIIKPYQSLTLDPATHVFHYGQAIFEGMKGYKDKAEQLWLFRPEENYIRLEKSCIRKNIPVLPKKIIYDGLNNIMKIEKNWIEEGKIDSETYSSLYNYSIENNENFWKTQGERIDWYKKYTKIKKNLIY